MRPSLIVCVALGIAGCKSSNNEGGELTREQCQELIRHVQTLQSADVGGLRDALHASRRSNLETCLRNGTERAYRCVLQAEGVGDLESCESLYK